ncbi:hypothetical protein K491DRAFT_722852 [Lophiostoma macrostomum CBS 122681]|uniref:ASST-domain-containing protein n=1 Tax=Lophiostoma macrostomum CBS 122681 TaxID=1314788 RepID=A0A6A6SP13_9PLEO|nr:hypothetical protein K491DRAFT_722852 [Lophiostoma macrostomum CBS 122681]
MSVFRSLAAGLLAASSLVHAQDSVSFNIDTYGQGDASGTPFQTYQSNSDVKPPQLQINKNSSGLAAGYVFIGVDGAPTSSQNWPTIYDMSDERMEISHFQAAKFGDNMGDLHEFTITSDDTALIIIYHAIPADLSVVDGPEDGWIFECTFQELNIETGDVVFEWNASTHVGVNETYNELGGTGSNETTPFDYFHMNSVQKDKNGDYLVSGRVMDTVYKISGNDGSIIWKLNGKDSDFDVDSNGVFAFQHDARWVNSDMKRITLFDNGPTDTIGYSRGLLFAIDEDAKTATLITEFTNEAQTFGQFEGCLQAIDPADDATNYFLGYGSQQFFAELDKDGNVLLDVQFGATNAVNSYRAYKLPWTGRPRTKPDVHYDQDGNKIYFSWNGATDVETWGVYTANDTQSSTWTRVANATRTGFETTIDLQGVGLQTYVRGKAVNGTGANLGWTRASDGTSLFDANDNVNDSNSTSTSSSSSSIATSSSTGVTAATSASSTGLAAARPTAGLGLREQVYVAAVVVVGGLAMA